MSKFERVLSDDDLLEIATSKGSFIHKDGYGALVYGEEKHPIHKAFLLGMLRAVDVSVQARLAEQEPVAYLYADEVYGSGDSDINDYIRANGDPLYAHPMPSASETESFVLRCDYCKKETDDPWHGSGVIGDVKSKHIHACDDCVHLLPQPMPSSQGLLDSSDQEDKKELPPLPEADVYGYRDSYSEWLMLEYGKSAIEHYKSMLAAAPKYTGEK